MVKKKAKSAKKLTKVMLKKRARIDRRKHLVQWSLDIRARDGNECIVCHATGRLNAHHLIPKERFQAVMFELNNGISLCASCHKFGAYSFHRHMIWAAEWLKNNRPDQYQWAVETSKRLRLEQQAQDRKQEGTVS